MVRAAFRMIGWLGLAVSCCVASAQVAPYSKSPEYRKMIEELHQPAPSPLYIATGERARVDAALRVEVKEDGQSLRLRTEAMEFTIDKTTTLVSEVDLRTKAQWVLSVLKKDAACEAKGARPARVARVARQGQGNQWSIAISGACGESTLSLELLRDGLARLTLARGAEGSTGLHVEGGGPFFGLGERFGQAGLAGTELDVRPQDKYGEPGHNYVYVAIPLVYGAGGLGMYADTAFDTKFRFDGIGSAAGAGTGFDMKAANGPVPIYLFAEGDPKAVLGAYTALTGRPQNPPLWTFGPWITALGGKGAVLDAAERIRAEAIPASALWVYDEMEEPNNLGWPFWFSNYYGEAKPFVAALHGLGYRVLTYVHPYVRERLLPYPAMSPAYEKGVRERLLMLGPDGRPSGPGFEPVRTGNIDFTNPAAVDWWQGMLTAAVHEDGFDGWMEDFGEWVRDEDRFAAGDGRTLSELYPLLYHKISLRIAQAMKGDIVPFSRSGSPGSQQWSPVLWGADQSPNWSRDYGLPSVVTAGITAGMSGYSTWGPDIFSAGDSRELWTRWVEFGALTPVMRDHPWSKPDRSINLFTDAETTALFRRYAMLHSSLLPYFATYAAAAHETGVPIMRHPVLEYPDDPRSAGAEYQYLLGAELLVAPVVEAGAATRTLYLPRGEWVNYWSGDHLTGGREVTVGAPVEQIPMLVRAGSVLPFLPEGATAGLDWNDGALLEGALVWRAYLSASGVTDRSFSMPDGTSARLVQGAGAGSVAIEGQSRTERAYEVVVSSKGEPVEVRLDGKALMAGGGEGLGTRAKGASWWFNPSAGEAHFRFRARDFRLEMKGVTVKVY